MRVHILLRPKRPIPDDDTCHQACLDISSPCYVQGRLKYLLYGHMPQRGFRGTVDLLGGHPSFSPTPLAPPAGLPRYRVDQAAVSRLWSSPQSPRKALPLNTPRYSPNRLFSHLLLQSLCSSLSDIKTAGITRLQSRHLLWKGKSVA